MAYEAEGARKGGEGVGVVVNDQKVGQTWE
jgi:hypothetical protein